MKQSNQKEQIIQSHSDQPKLVGTKKLIIPRSKLHKQEIISWLKQRHEKNCKKNYLYVPEEFVQIVNIQSIFKQFDKDQSNALDPDELLEIFKSSGVNIKKSEIIHFMKSLDQNSDLTLDLKELNKSILDPQAHKVFADIIKDVRKRDQQIQLKAIQKLQFRLQQKKEAALKNQSKTILDFKNIVRKSRKSINNTVFSSNVNSLPSITSLTDLNNFFQEKRTNKTKVNIIPSTFPKMVTYLNYNQNREEIKKRYESAQDNETLCEELLNLMSLTKEYNKISIQDLKQRNFNNEKQYILSQQLSRKNSFKIDPQEQEEDQEDENQTIKMQLKNLVKNSKKEAKIQAHIQFEKQSNNSTETTKSILNQDQHHESFAYLKRKSVSTFDLHQNLSKYSSMNENSQNEKQKKSFNCHMDQVLQKINQNFDKKKKDQTAFNNKMKLRDQEIEKLKQQIQTYQNYLQQQGIKYQKQNYQKNTDKNNIEESNNSIIKQHQRSVLLRDSISKSVYRLSIPLDNQNQDFSQKSQQISSNNNKKEIISQLQQKKYRCQLFNIINNGKRKQSADTTQTNEGNKNFIQKNHQMQLTQQPLQFNSKNFNSATTTPNLSTRNLKINLQQFYLGNDSPIEKEQKNQNSVPTSLMSTISSFFPQKFKNKHNLEKTIQSQTFYQQQKFNQLFQDQKQLKRTRTNNSRNQSFNQNNNI